MSCLPLKGPVDRTLNNIEFYKRFDDTPHESFAKDRCRLQASGLAFSVTTFPGTGKSVCTAFADFPYVSDVKTTLNVDGASKTVFCQF